MNDNFGGLFNLDNPILISAAKLVDILWLGLLWAVSCVFVVTAGSSTAALFYTVTKVVQGKASGSVTRIYIRALRENFAQGCALWLLWAGMTAFFGIDVYVLFTYLGKGLRLGLLLPVVAVLLVLCLMWGCYLFPYIARFENTNREALLLSFAIMVRNPGWSLLLLGLLCAGAAAVWCCPLLYLIIGGCVMALQSLVLERVFRKYMPAEA